MGHILELVLVQNLIQDIVDKERMCDAIARLEAGLVIKMGNAWKLKSLQTSIDFLLTTFDKNNDTKVCGFE